MSTLISIIHFTHSYNVMGRIMNEKSMGRVIGVKRYSREDNIVYSVIRGDTIMSIADKFAVPVQSMLADNELCGNEDLAVGDLIYIRHRNSGIYVVKPAETISLIASKLGVTVDHLKRLNNINAIYIGQKILY